MFARSVLFGIIPALFYSLEWIPHLQLNPTPDSGKYTNEFWDHQRIQCSNVHPYCSYLVHMAFGDSTSGLLYLTIKLRVNHCSYGACLPQVITMFTTEIPLMAINRCHLFHCASNQSGTGQLVNV